jgi:hypothetical protein
MKDVLRLKDVKNSDLISFRYLISIIVLLSLIFIQEDNFKYSIYFFIILFNILFYFKVIFKHMYVSWINLGLILGIINSTVLFTFMYLFILTPIGLFFRLNKRDILGRYKFKRSEKTYWIKRKIPPTSMKWQY